jgi:DNA repair exonuclease SbcCD ATPase subunit
MSLYESDQELETGSQDATADSSSAPETETQSQQTSAQQGSSAEPEKAPFHEHPRFKELIEERKQYASQLEEMRSQLERLQQQSKPAEQSKAHPFVAKLKEIDPAYGEWAEKLEMSASQIEKFQQWQQAQESKALLSQYESSIEKLHTDNKTPDEVKGMIRKLVDSEIRSNPKLGLKDVPNVYKSVHEEYTKLIDGVKRSERASYVTDKRKDSSAPSSMPKGKPASHSSKSEYGMDREANMAMIARKALRTLKAENDT